MSGMMMTALGALPGTCVLARVWMSGIGAPARPLRWQLAIGSTWSNRGGLICQALASHVLRWGVHIILGTLSVPLHCSVMRRLRKGILLECLIAGP